MKKNISIGIIVSEFNRHVTDRLLHQCTLTLTRHGIPKKNIRSIWAPGAYELPLFAKRLARSKKYDAIICLGCIIKGDTDHDKHISQWAAHGIGIASLETNTPILFGVLTVKNESQAIQRSRPGPLNRGKEMADAAIQMITTLRQEGI